MKRDLTENKNAEPVVEPEASMATEKDTGADFLSADETGAGEEPELLKKKKDHSEGWMILLLLVMIGAVGTLVFFAVRMALQTEPEKAVSITDLKIVASEPKAAEKAPAAEEENKTEPAPVVDPAKTEAITTGLTVNVLNGGAVVGTAGKIQSFLTTKGYAKVDAKNAASSAHVGTAIYYSANFKAEAEKLLTVLKEKYPDIILKSAVSAEEKSAELVVMLGK